jgi:hypothetical protein
MGFIGLCVRDVVVRGGNGFCMLRGPKEYDLRSPVSCMQDKLGLRLQVRTNINFTRALHSRAM